MPQRLHAAMRYAVLGGGKRVRPLLVYAAGEVTAADAEALDRAALAVEYVHAYSLVHDDLPCMDNDVLRRGKPTVHVAFDEATAMLAGDACRPKPSRSSPTVRTAGTADGIADARTGACGRTRRACAAVRRSTWRRSDGRLTLPELERMHRMKTGALLARRC